uniref:Uncharacterized protein n=1 Tax=Glossina palpalis gambiensis TaxID=67801 RepID=A0A1B0AXW4_9MUSC
MKRLRHRLWTITTFWLLLPISLKKYLFIINFYLSYIMGKSRSGLKEHSL